MDPRDADLLAKLLPTFRLEAEEHLRNIGKLLTDLARELSPMALEEAFREAHSLKGAARAVGAQELENLCQELENVFAGVSRGDLPLNRDLLDLLFLATDMAADSARQAGRETSAEMIALVEEASRRLRDAAQGQGIEASPARRPRPGTDESAPIASLETLRIDAKRIERVLIQAEELLTDKLAARHQIALWREFLGRLEPLRRDLAAAARGGGVPSHSETAKALEDSARQILLQGGQNYRSLAMKIDGLLGAVRETLMLPVGNLLEQFPRIVRDLSRESDKQAELEVAGGEILVDRRILEELRDPLLHLLRNAIDHGLEAPAERSARQKPERGLIRLQVSSPSPRRVLFTLSDDGRGMDLGKLKEAAIRKQVLAAEEAEALDDWQTAELSFFSGISTQQDVTALSGRGLGLPIVREKVERLGGQVQVTSRAGEGTTFQLEIPAALAAFRGILVRLGTLRFVFPAIEVERVLRIPQQHLALLENREVCELEGKALPVVQLEEPLRLPLGARGREAGLTAVVTDTPQGRVAFAVDEILGEQELLIKGLGNQLKKVPAVSGAAILGDGGIALILDPGELVSSSSRAGAVPAQPQEERTEPARRRVLVVEDSITSRTLLRNILEGAGYAVTTAVDGIDALERLTAAVFDIVVSDVEMPRMDGFHLTRRIRQSYDRLPVILVTGLDNQQDRERGIEVGADAYIIKSRFDQSNLLEVIGRLL
jgi:two-component system, chemotaxis family, sensor kinase CheA